MSKNSKIFATTRIEATDITSLWINLVSTLNRYGSPVTVRGQKTKELLGVTLILRDSQQCVLAHPVRKLNYRFMIAEWVWIMSVSDDLEFLQKYNSLYAQFSDDGVKLAGAYGPRIRPQIPYLFNTIKGDNATRQAVAAIWTPNPAPSKDIPCTLTLQFLVRDERLHMIVSMRSSDCWLGIPYDTFSFAMIQNVFAGGLRLQPGELMFQLGSSHLYETNFEQANEVMSSRERGINIKMPIVPEKAPDRAQLTGDQPLEGFWETIRLILTSTSKASQAFAMLSQHNEFLKE